MAVNPIPDNYPQVTPYLCVKGAAAAIDFYTQVFGAVERGRIPGPDERIGHAELQLGSGLIMLADEHPEIGVLSPETIGGSPVTISVYVEDVDEVFAKALDLGAEELRPLTDQFYGDRSGQIRDPFGHKWSLASHVEDIDEEEMHRRAAEMSSGG